MVGEEYGITKDQYLEREELKRFYNNPIGIGELCDLVRAGGLLNKIPVGDTNAIFAHNYAIDRLERLGLLDEEYLEDLIKWMLNRQPKKLPLDA